MDKIKYFNAKMQESKIFSDMVDINTKLVEKKITQKSSELIDGIQSASHRQIKSENQNHNSVIKCLSEMASDNNGDIDALLVLMHNYYAN